MKNDELKKIMRLGRWKLLIHYMSIGFLFLGIVMIIWTTYGYYVLHIPLDAYHAMLIIIVFIIGNQSEKI